MFNREIHLIKILGVDITVDLSWFWIFLLVIYTFAVNLLPQTNPGRPLVTYVAVGVSSALLFFISVLLHELSHTLTAKYNGLPVRKITLFLFGGVSNLIEEPPSARVEFGMAIAGPIASLFIAGIFFILHRLISPVFPNSLFVISLLTLGYINVSLAIFNLVPGFPLDGGRILRSILWWRTGKLMQSTKVAANSGKFIAILLGLLGILEIITTNFLGGFWMILVSLFLYQAASDSYFQTRVSQILGKTKVFEAMNNHPASVQSTETIADFANTVSETRRDYYVVNNDAEVTGIVASQTLNKVKDGEWSHKIDEIMIPASKVATISPEESVTKAMEKFSESNHDAVLVEKNHRILGLLSMMDLRYFVFAHIPKNKKR